MIRKASFIFLLLSGYSFSAFSQKIIGETTVTARMRVIVDNDFGGDPDGLFQLTHLLLSPSVEIRAITPLISMTN